MKELCNAGHLLAIEEVFVLSMLILLIFGVLPSIFKSDWTWFGRSGALLVVFGIYVVWLDYKGIIDNSLDTVSDGYDEYLKNLTPEQSKKILIKQLERYKVKYTDEEIDKILKHPTAKDNAFKPVSEKFNKISKLTHKRAQNIEFYILLLGTLVWGYGDLINEIDFESSSPIKQNEVGKTFENKEINTSSFIGENNGKEKGLVTMTTPILTY